MPSTHQKPPVAEKFIMKSAREVLSNHAFCIGSTGAIPAFPFLKVESHPRIPAAYIGVAIAARSEGTAGDFRSVVPIAIGSGYIL